MNLIRFEIMKDHIGIITLEREKAANALSQSLLEEFQALLAEIAINYRTLRVIILTGAGEKAFCAGADLKERKGMTDEEVIQAVAQIKETANLIEALPMPVIAKLNGVAFGGGLEFALACDIRIANESISLGLTETSLAIIPGAGGTQRLARLIGIGRAKDLIYRGARIDAQTAYQYGILEHLVPKENLDDFVMHYAEDICENGPIAVQLAKEAINGGIQLSLSEGLQLESRLYEQTIQTTDRREGLKAFSEKRKARYTGK